jgi:dipeptidyl aminopeptidase/acylaminoacyl peptidase
MAPAPPRPQQIFTQAFDGAPRKQITSTAYSHRSVAVSPDGKWVAFIADARLRSDSVVQAEADSVAMLPFDAARDQAPRNDADIFIAPIDGGAPRKIAELPGSETVVKWSPDGKRLAFLSSASRTSSARLWLIDVAGGAPRNLVGTWKYEPGDFEWVNNDEIAFGADIGGRAALYSVAVKNGQMKEVLGGRRRMSAFTWDADRKNVAFVSTSLDKPTELFIADREGKNERKLTSFNDPLNKDVAFTDGERFTYTSVGGLEVEAWLLRPYGYTAGKRYPLVLYIHGGPHSSYGEGWFDEFQNLTGMGFMVLFTNPRGSSGYGADFTFSTRGRWFAEDYEDLMKAVDIAAKRPDVDSTRMGVTGGSYGGVMTAWVTVKTNRFKAAQADRMISNWWSWYGTSDAQGLTEFEFFGKPWDNPVMYDTLSPIRYAPRVKTPTFILQSEEDHRTPMTDAEQWFIALKKHGVPVEFVRYPRSTHDLSRTGEPWLLVDRLHRLRLWFAHWLKPDPLPAAAATSNQRNN